MAYVSVEITPETVVDAMADDPNFSAEIWAMIANRLYQGLMHDDFCDMIRGIEDRGLATAILVQLTRTIEAAKFN